MGREEVRMGAVQPAVYFAIHNVGRVRRKKTHAGRA